MLQDKFGRDHDYLRISLTDVCNFRCQYCIPEEITRFMPSAHLMQAYEIEAIAKTFVDLGVRKIRMTGGEPLARKDAADIMLRLAQFPVELTLTTNGSRADEFLTTFKNAGIRSINVSLDTLNPDKFKQITRRDYFHKVYDNILLFVDEGFHVKVNVVVMRGINDDEIADFIAWTRLLPLHVRFIEFMPFDSNQWNNEKVFSYQEILNAASEACSFVKIRDEKNGTAKKFKPLMHEGTFAIISTMSAPFCANCNRMRLTADGKMKNCLFSKGEVDLLTAFRNGQDIVPLVKQCLLDKAEALGGQFGGDYNKIDAGSLQNRKMISIGG